MFLMENWFNSKKSAQVAAFFCEKEGGVIPVLKLVKLIYLSDREFLEECGLAITNDLHVSMDHGPVNSITYNLIGGSSESNDWSDLISGRSGSNVALSRERVEDDTSELSDAEIEALERVWDRFGGMTKYVIRDWTHKNCPEWENPHGSSYPIPLERTLRFLNVEEAESFADRATSYRAFRSAMSDIEEKVVDYSW